MSLTLRSNSLLRKIKHLGSSGVAQSAVVTTTAGGVGLLAGKRADQKNIPLIALGAGAVLSTLGASGLGDGAMAAGATIFGYKVGAKTAGPKLLEAGARAPGQQNAQRRPQRRG